MKHVLFACLVLLPFDLAFADQRLFDQLENGKIDWVLEQLDMKPRLLSSTDRQGRTLLHYAVANNRVELVVELMNRGLGLTADQWGQTPLDLANERETTFPYIIEILTEEQARQNAPDAQEEDAQQLQQEEQPIDGSFLWEAPEVDVEAAAIGEAQVVEGINHAAAANVQYDDRFLDRVEEEIKKHLPHYFHGRSGF